MTIVKICGLRTEEAVVTTADCGADMMGVVFFEPSPRHIEPARAAEILDHAPHEIQRVGLFVDPDTAFIAQILRHVRLDIIQLHGKESPERIEEVRQEFGLPVMKALAIASSGDVDLARAYDGVADYLLFDAKPPKGADRPGGNAASFDWALLAGTNWSVPWMLAGGLGPDNVAEAIRISGAPGVDVSSGVEESKGVKSLSKIEAFLKACKG